VTRRFALLLVVLVTAATFTAVALVSRGGSEPDSDVRDDRASCTDTVESDAFNSRDAVESDAFNFPDAVACPNGRRRAEPE
jgi:hypothetical protein